MSNFNPGNFYKTIDRYGTEIVLEGAPDFIPTPVDYTPSSSGNTQNINEFVIDPNGDIFFVDKDGEAFKVNTAQTVTTITDTITGHKIASYTNENGVVSDINETITVLGNLTYDPVTGLLTIPYTDEAGIVNNKTATISQLNVLTTVQPTPTATGNTTNLNSAFVDASGNSWIVDSNGDAILTGTAVSISNVQALGNKIADITIGGVTTSINETITSISAFSISGNTITLTYIDEAGATNTKTLDVPSDVITNITNTVTGHKIGTYTNELGAIIDINETITVLGNLTYDSVTGLLTIPYTDEAGVVNNKTATIASLNVLTTAQPTPTATGNTTNLNSAFKDAAGNTWVVDANGDAVQAGNAPFKNLNEWHVDPNGSDTTGDGSQEKPFATITKAVSVAGQGDQIIVHAGVYTENVTISTPNVSLVGAQSDWGSLSQINGTVTVTASGTSVKIADLTINSIVDTGTGDLYIENTTVNSTLSSSAGYLEIRNSRIQDGTITKTGGSMLIEGSKIDNVSVSGVNTAAFIRDSYQDANTTITYGAGSIYGIYNVQGGEISINASAIPVETAALAQGLSAEMAKEAETADFQKLGMIRPDTEASPTKVVTWDEVTGRLEVTDLSIISGDQYKTTSTTCQDIVSTGEITLTVEPGLAYTPLQDIIVYADASNHMHGQVVSYNSTTGVLVMDVHQKSGSGNFCSWTVNLDAIKLNEVSVYFGTQDPDTAGQTGIEGDLYYVTSDGTGTGTVTETWVYDVTYGWVQIPMSSPELVQFGTAAPTVTTGYTAGDEYFVTSDGTSAGSITAQYIFDGTSWVLRPTPVAQLTTTSLSPKVYQSGSFVNAQANTEANVADLLQLSDGSRIHDGEITWTGHGLTVGAWYYLSQTTPGAYTTTRPTSGLVQQLFFVEDANTIHVDIEEAWAVSGTSSDTFAKTVYVNATSPTSATIFDLANPPVTNDDTLKADSNNIYIGTDGSFWTYKSSTSSYVTYVQTGPYVVHAHSPAVLSVANNTSGTLINYATTQANSAGTAWNAATGTFTVPRAGYYQVSASVEWQGVAWALGNIFATSITKNGAIVAAIRMTVQAAHTSGFNCGVPTGIVYCAVGDVIRLSAFQVTGAARNTSATNYTYLTIHEIK